MRAPRRSYFGMGFLSSVTKALSRYTSVIESGLQLEPQLATSAQFEWLVGIPHHMYMLAQVRSRPVARLPACVDRRRTPPPQVRQSMLTLYDALSSATMDQPVFQQVRALLSERDRGPQLIHCAGGGRHCRAAQPRAHQAVPPVL